VKTKSELTLLRRYTPVKNKSSAHLISEGLEPESGFTS